MLVAPTLFYDRIRDRGSISMATRIDLPSIPRILTDEEVESVGGATRGVYGPAQQ
jgi:hypothetical protein